MIRDISYLFFPFLHIRIHKYISVLAHAPHGSQHVQYHEKWQISILGPSLAAPDEQDIILY